MVTIKIELGNFDSENHCINYSERFANGKKFTDVVEQGSYNITEKLTFGSKSSANTFKVQISGKAGEIDAFSSYEYIRVYKDNVKTFEGLLASVSRTVKKADFVEASITYDDYFSLFKDVKFCTVADLTDEEKANKTDDEIEEYVENRKAVNLLESDGYKISDPSDQEHSLVHHLFGLLFMRAEKQKFGSSNQNLFSLECDYTDLTPVKHFNAKADDGIQKVLLEFLSQNGLALHIHCSTVKVVDMLAVDSGTATTVLDIESGAKVEDKPYNTVELPKINLTEVQFAPHAQVGYWQADVPGVSHATGNVEFDYTANDKVKELKYENVSYKESHSKSWLDNGPEMRKFRQIGDKVFIEVYNTAWAVSLRARVWIYADVTYLKTKDEKIVPSFDGNYTVSKEENAEYIHDVTHATRYLKALYLSKLRDKRTYSFYADDNFSIGQVIVINGLPASDGYLKIVSKQDKLDAFDGYNYTAVKIMEADNLSTDTFYNPQDVELKDRPGFEYAISRLIIPCDGAGAPIDNTPVTIRITPNNMYQTPTLSVQGNAVTLARDYETHTDGNGEQYIDYLDSYSYQLAANLTGLDSVTLTMTLGTVTKIAKIEKAKTGAGPVTVIQFSYGSATQAGSTWTSDTLNPDNTKYIWCRTGTYTPPQTVQDIAEWQVFRLGGEPVKSFELLADRSTFTRNLRNPSGTTSISLIPQIATYSGTYRIRCFINTTSGAVFTGYTESSLTCVIPYNVDGSCKSLIFVMDMTDSDGVTHTSAVSLSQVDETGNRAVYGSKTTQIAPDSTYDSATGDYFIKGDSYTYVYQGTDASGNDAKISEVWVFDDNPDGSGNYWHKAEYYSSGTMAELDNILLDNLKNVFEEYGALNHVSANGYDWFKYLIAEHISAIYYNVGGYIYGGELEFDSGGNPVRVNGKGFIISADGSITINQAILDNCEIKNNLNFGSGAEIKHPLFSTFQESFEDAAGIAVNTSQNKYNINDLYTQSSVGSNTIKSVTGTYGSDSVTKLIKLLNPDKTLCDVIHSYSDTVTASAGNRANPVNHTELTIPQAVRSGTITFTFSVYSLGGYGAPRNTAFQLSATKLDGTAYVVSGNGDGHNAPRTYSYVLDSSVIYFSKSIKADVWSGVTYSEFGGPDYFRTNTLTVSGTYTSYFSDDGFTSQGLYLYYGSAWHNMGINTLYNSSTALNLTSGVVWNSANYLRRLPTNLCDYTSFTYTNAGGTTSTQTLANGISYPAVSTGFTINGSSVTIKYITRQSTDIVQLTDSNNKVHTFIRGQYYRFTGTKLRVSGSSYGLQTKGLYPDATGAHDLGRADRYYENAYIHNLNGSSGRMAAYIVEAYKNGFGWYRVWSDGWCEQGGVVELDHDTLTDLTLYKAYDGGEISVTVTDRQTGFDGWTCLAGYALSATQIRVKQKNHAGGKMWINWVTAGKLPQ